MSLTVKKNKSNFHFLPILAFEGTNKGKVLRNMSIHYLSACRKSSTETLMKKMKLVVLEMNELELREKPYA